jgi:predicted ATPase/DNA-binding winged helix-turn-helix (wHTH) protein
MTYVFGPFELDQARFELRQDGAPLSVEPKVLGLLLLLVRERDRSVDKRELLATNWAGATVGEGSLTRAVMEARKAIGDDAHTMIVTVRGRGFRFAASVEERGAPAVSVDRDRSLVGRSMALMALEARLEAAAKGRGSVGWVTGEAGIGKTAVVEEVARSASTQGFETLRARCHEGTSPPYWVWTQLARACVDAAERERWRTPLGTLRPLADGGLWPEAAATTSLATFDGFVRDLRAVSRLAPLYLVLEDAHWADEASLTLLQFVAREVIDSRIFLVVSCRDRVLPDGVAGKALERAMYASGGAAIPLRPLTKDDVRVLVERESGPVPSSATVERLHSKSGGNPLHLRELLRVSADESDEARAASTLHTSRSAEITGSMKASIERHLEAISAPCRELLAVAAVLGPTFDFPRLAVVTQRPHDVLLDQLAQAERARLVEKTAGGTYSFRHALVRSVLSRALSGTDRAKAHASIARVLDAHWGAAEGAHAEELAHHYVRALPYGDPQRALDTSVRAAELSLLRGAGERAVTHYTRAIESLRHLPGEEARGIELLLALGRALEARSVDKAREAYLDAAVLATALGNVEQVAEAALALAASAPTTEAVRALARRAHAGLVGSSAEVAAGLLQRLAVVIAAEAGSPHGSIVIPS